MENNALKYEVTMNNLDHLINEWKDQPHRKGARQDIIEIKNRLFVEHETGCIPLLHYRRETLRERLGISRGMIINFIGLVLIGAVAIFIEPIFKAAVQITQGFMG